MPNITMADAMKAALGMQQAYGIDPLEAALMIRTGMGGLAMFGSSAQPASWATVSDGSGIHYTGPKSLSPAPWGGGPLPPDELPAKLGGSPGLPAPEPWGKTSSPPRSPHGRPDRDPAPPAADAPEAPTAPRRPPTDPLCGTGIKYLREHGVPGKPHGWLFNVEKELCGPDLRGYDLPLCPERQMRRYCTTFGQEIDRLGSDSAQVRQLGRNYLLQRLRAAPCNRGPQPGPDGVIRDERECSRTPYSLPAAPTKSPSQPEDGSASVGQPHESAVGGTGTVPPPAESTGVVTAGIPPHGFIPPPERMRRGAMAGAQSPHVPGAMLPYLESGRREFDGMLVDSLPGFGGLFDPSEFESAGPVAFRESPGAWSLPREPGVTDVPRAPEGTQRELISTNDFLVHFAETGGVWPAYS